MKILIIGRARHGKTTTATALRKQLTKKDFKVGNYATSQFLIHRLSEVLHVPLKQIEDNKNEYRPRLIELGNLLCDLDPGILASICLFTSKKANDDVAIVDGVRRKNEYDRVKEYFDLILYVERKIDTIKDNFELDHVKDIASTIYLENDGTQEDLENKISQIIENLK